MDGEYSYDIENLFQAAEQLYGSIGDGDVSGLKDSHPVTFVYYEKQTDGSMKEVGRAEDAFTYSYTTGQLVKLATPNNLSWTGDDGFTASWGSVEHAEGYWVRFYETVSGSTSKVVTKIVEGGTTCELTSLVPTPKDGATYAFEVRAIGPANDAQYTSSDWSAKSDESATWKTPVVEYGLTVGGVDVTSANAADVLNDGTVSYDPSSQTLTLKNASITGTNEGNCSIEVDPGMTLALTIALEGSNSCGPIMTQKGATTITGSGSLTVTQPNGGEGQTGISALDEISIDGAKLIVNSKESGITTNGGDVTIQNGAQVEISCTDKEAYCAIISKDLTVTGADTSLEASTDTWGSYYTINSSGDVSIENGASVDVTGRAYMSGDLEFRMWARCSRDLLTPPIA